MRIVHVSSAHPRHDTRIFVKQCQSLAAAGHQVDLVVADGQGEQVQAGITIHDVGRSSGRIGRMLGAAWRVVRLARALKADVYILHDPELLPLALLLKAFRFERVPKVVFDSHEDVPVQIMAKPYLPKALRAAVAACYGLLQSLVCRRLDGVLAATEVIRDKFLPIQANAIAIHNFPSLDEFSQAVQVPNAQSEVCYIGGISNIRGAVEMVQALSLLPGTVRLNLAGPAPDSELAQQLKNLPGWRQVNDLGLQNRQGVQSTLERSVAGLVVLHPTANYLESLPVKMFEYMAAGLPVIASNFPLWKPIVSGLGCGLCVDPMDPHSIAFAIEQLVQNPERAREMGQRGRQAVLHTYNWGVEEQKLLRFVQQLTGQ